MISIYFHLSVSGLLMSRRPRRRHMDLSDAYCVVFNQGHQSNKAGEQKHVAICHVPLGHEPSSRRTLGCVGPGGECCSCQSQAGSLLSPVPSPWDQPPKNVRSQLSVTIWPVSHPSGSHHPEEGGLVFGEPIWELRSQLEILNLGRPLPPPPPLAFSCLLIPFNASTMVPSLSSSRAGDFTCHPR